MLFSFTRVRIRMEAQGNLRFPSPLPANLLRGALGTVLLRWPDEYRVIFAPQGTEGPSGLRERPRPFVFRASQLSGQSFQPGQVFEFDLHVFDEAKVQVMIEAFSSLAQEGLGPGRTRVRMVGHEQQKHSLDLMPGTPASRLELDFLSPTELKHGGTITTEPTFPIVAMLAWTRLQNLCRFYSGAQIAAMPSTDSIRLIGSDREQVRAMRFSSRTRQIHPLGGFVGTVSYEGNLTAFVPYLRAAQFTGIGRQTTWGKGELRLRL